MLGLLNTNHSSLIAGKLTNYVNIIKEKTSPSYYTKYPWMQKKYHLCPSGAPCHLLAVPNRLNTTSVPCFLRLAP